LTRTARESGVTVGDCLDQSVTGGRCKAPYPFGADLMNTEDKKCPDCRGSLKPIQIVGKKTKNMGILKEDEWQYTVPEAKRSFWTGALPIEGKITAYMCDGCGRVLLYGQPRET
jgi:hypothetical protein